ncbi:MAG: hypothetical protein KJ970_20265 [Candidatus Eisenbacteria bacterium]|uniref:FlgD Ig-like domain-containing protein n=1 Tax=Eiseniibacteriota bacterium TaxID=2212470 RepID=A0A948S3Q4_UNCEI|nr:hypothetical protein [Candidatus Eisenbacteria bacterium]MBU1950686.1 hypothetical protein [Candidatus Eisenbacteria bacterium]MBU2693259.1 hypothetical protein [Candidatus Eisenbacteria bacterium]
MITMRFIICVLVGIFFISSTQVSASIPISSWGETLTASGETYILSNDLIDDGSTPYAIVVGAGVHHIEIQGMGFGIIGDYNPADWEGGILLDGGAPGLLSIDIEDLCFEGLDTGIYGAGTLCGLFISDNRFEALERGVAIGLHTTGAADILTWINIRDNLICSNNSHPIVIAGDAGAPGDGAPVRYLRIIGNTITKNTTPYQDPLISRGAVRLTGGGDYIRLQSNLCSQNRGMSGILFSSDDDAGQYYDNVKVSENILSYHLFSDFTPTPSAGLKLDRVYTTDAYYWNLGGNFYFNNEGAGLDYIQGSAAYEFSSKDSWWGDNAGPNGAFGDGVGANILWSPRAELPSGLVYLVPSQLIRCAAWRSVDVVLNQDLASPGLRGFNAGLTFASAKLHNLRFEEGGFLALAGGGYPTQYYYLGSGDERNISGAILGGSAPLATGNGDLFYMINRGLEQTVPLATNITPGALILRDPDNSPIPAAGLHGNSFEIDCQPPEVFLSFADSSGIPRLIVTVYENVPIEDVFYRVPPTCWNPLLLGGVDECYFHTELFLDEFIHLPGGEYEIEVCSVDAAGNKTHSTIILDWVTGIAPGSPMDPLPALAFSATPTPFVTQTVIAFTTAVAGRAEIAVFSLTGRRIRVLADKDLSPGRHSWIWDGRNNEGHPVAGGAYFARLRLNDQVLMNKIVKLQ